MKRCFNCGSYKTYINRKNRNLWYHHNEKLYCKKCQDKLFTNPKWHPITNPKFNTRHLVWTPSYKQILLQENPRTGYCSWCSNNIFNKSCKRTHIHHIMYDKEDPLKHTIELCASCHAKETRIKK